MSILKKIKELAGTAGDAIIPGDQSAWHQPPRNTSPFDPHWGQYQQAYLGQAVDNGDGVKVEHPQANRAIYRYNATVPFRMNYPEDYTMGAIDQAATGSGDPTIEDWLRRSGGVDY